MTQLDRERALKDIRENIARYGYHLYVVSGDLQPRFAYTIGLSPKIGKELILAGAIFYMYKQVAQIIKELATKLVSDPASQGSVHRVDPYGTFTLREVDLSWSSALMLGALDLYQKADVAALQIVPEELHWTIDVPDMRPAWSGDTSPVWRWLKEPWAYPVPTSSHAVTDIDSLRGAPITEACRWEDDYWELFAGAGPEVPDEQKRVVPLGTLLGADPSLSRVLELRVGEGIWRDEVSDWHIWQTREPPS